LDKSIIHARQLVSKECDQDGRAGRTIRRPKAAGNVNELREATSRRVVSGRLIVNK
jgi:hypothetical protein